MDDKFFKDLVKDTDFTIADTGSLMHSRTKVKTPLVVLNCIYGGGIPLGVMSEVSGPPSSGKSTFLYQCMANYQKQYPDGVPVILDMEASMDNDRLEALGVDTQHVLRLPATSMEKTFANLFKLLNKLVIVKETRPDVSSFIVYDSLSAGGTDKQQETIKSDQGDAFGVDTMMALQRILKTELSNTLPYIEKFPIFLGLINQVFTHVDKYGHSSIKSAGGFGLKHFCHSHIDFSEGKDNYDGSFLMGTSSMVQLKKSKLSPKIIDIPCEIDATQGGRIDEIGSFVKYLAENQGVPIITNGSWYEFGTYLTQDMPLKYPVLSKHKELTTRFEKKLRKADMYKVISEDEDLFKLLQVALIEFLDGIYPAQRKINEEYQQELIKSCKYFEEV